LIAIKETHLGQDIEGQKALKLEMKTHKNVQTEKAGKNTTPVKTLTVASTLRIYHIFFNCTFFVTIFLLIFV